MRFYTTKAFVDLEVGDILVARDTERRYRVTAILEGAVAAELLIGPLDVTTLPMWLAEVPGEEP